MILKDEARPAKFTNSSIDTNDIQENTKGILK